MKIKANGITQYYEFTGSGDWLVLIHTSMVNHNIWYNQVPAFSKHYKVLTYDLRGCGKTNLVGPYTNSTWADDLYYLLKALGINQAHLLGHAVGGTIAVTFINKYPGVAKSLVLSSSGGIPITEGGTRNYEELCDKRLAAMEKDGVLGLCKTLCPPWGYMFSPGFAEKHPETMEKWKAVMLQSTAPQLIDVLGYRSPKLKEERFDITLAKYEKMYRKVTCPTLITCGERDEASGPEPSKKIQSWISKAELKIFPTAHLTYLEMPEEYNKTVLAFLAKVSKTSARR